MKKRIVLCAALLSVSVWVKAPEISSAQLVGSWKCHYIIRQNEMGGGLETELNVNFHIGADGKLQLDYPSIILRHIKSGETVRYRAKIGATWGLKDNVLQKSNEQLLLFEHTQPLKILSEQELKERDSMIMSAMNAKIGQKAFGQLEIPIEMPDADTLLLHKLEDNMQARCVRIKS